VGYLRTHASQERAEPLEERRLTPYHDAERAVAGGLRGACDRRVGEGNAARPESLTELSCERHWTGAHVDHGLARLHEGGETSTGAAPEADRAHLRLSRQAQEHDFRATRYLGQRGRGLHAIRRERGQRRWPLVEGHYRGPGLSHQVSTHRLAHDSEADESEDCRCHACLPVLRFLLHAPVRAFLERRFSMEDTR